MSKRSNQKRMSNGARTLKFLREQAKLSFRGAAATSGLGEGVINHLEHGRIDIHPHHLEKLLKAYGATLQTYEMFACVNSLLPKDVRFECLEIIRVMSLDQLRTAYPVLASLASHK